MHPEVIVIKRTLIALSLLFLSLPLFAQMNDLGVFISTSQFENSEINDAGDVFDVEFDEDMGLGVLYNRFWTTGFSTEFAYQRLGADMSVSLGDVAAQVAELDLDVLSGTAQLHFGRRGLFNPYIGAGVAYISGEAGFIDEEELESVDFESEVEYLANAGLNVGLGRSFTVFVDGKYILFGARGEGEPEEETLDLNPLVISGGVKWRF